MEIKAVIKARILTILMFIVCTSYAQNEDRNDHYSLYEGGRPFLKPVVYIQLDSSNMISHENGIDFNAKQYRFSHNVKIHEAIELVKEDLTDIKFNELFDLHKLEKNEIKRSREIVERRTGFEPVAPLEHKVLKIFIVVKFNAKIMAFETVWKLSHIYD